MKSLILFLILSVFPWAIYAQETSPSLFRIGYLRDASESGFQSSEMNILRRALLDDEAFVGQLNLAGYDSIGLYEADGASDLLPRMASGEFQLVFASARTWSEVSQDYEVILQTREPRDIINPRTGRATRRGVIFITPRHPAFDEEWSEGQWAEYFHQHPVAVVQSQSLTGYIAPMLALRDQLSIREESLEYLWCASGEEVTKSAIAGLVDVGVCEELELEETLEKYQLEDRRDELVKVVFRTAPVPTTPVLVQTTLPPTLKVEVARTVQKVSSDGVFNNSKLIPATSVDYREVSRMIQRYESDQPMLEVAP